MSPRDDQTRHIGIVYGAHAAPEELIGFAVRVEELGLGQLWLVEDCFLAGGMTLATTALAVTQRIGVGVGLLPVPLRNPALAAMEIATLARCHPQRFTAAFGHGVRSWMDQVGALPAKRLRALEEAVTAVRALLAGAAVTSEGEYTTLRAVQLEMPPHAVPDIIVGSTGPRGLELGWRAADGVLLPEGCGPEFVEWAVSRGTRTPASRCAVYAWLAIYDSPDRAVSAVAPALRKWALSEHYPWPRQLAGLSREPTELREDQVAELAHRVCVAGNSAECARALKRLFQAGADDVLLVPQGEDVMGQVERLSAEVLPLLRG